MRASAWLGLALCACGVSVQPAPVAAPTAAPSLAQSAAVEDPVEVGLSRPPTPAEAALIRELAAQTERLRGLRFRAPVTVRIQDRTAMRAYVESALDEEELARARRRYLALGLLSPALDVRELIAALMEEELVGYYDPERKQLAIRDDVAGALARHTEPGAGDLEWRATVVHELVHALQDQHLGLSETMEQPRTTDQENAFGAVIEGDATLAMLGYVAELQGSSLAALVSDIGELSRSLHENPIQAGGRLAEAPALVREPLLFRYREGAVYMARLFARAGWEAVNQAHRSLPNSTFAVREGGARADGISQPPDLGGASTCQTVDRDVLGSLEISAALGSAALSPELLAKAWRGDSYSVLACQGVDASLWVLHFATPSIARRVRSVLLQADAEGKQQREVVQQGSYLLVARRLSAEQLRQAEPVFRAWASAPH